MGDMRQGHAALAKSGRQIASIAHPLGDTMARCAHCEDSGSVWIVCPDAGAVKVPCHCRQQRHEGYHVGLADLGAAAVFAGGCAALFMLL